MNYLMLANSVDIETDINRLKVVLVEQNCTGKWFTEQLGKNEASISRWCSNLAQPLLKMSVKIASILQVDLNGK